MHRFHVWPKKVGPVTVVIDYPTVHADLASAIKAYGPYSFDLSEDGERVLRGVNFVSPGFLVRFYDGYGLPIDARVVMDCVEECIRESRARSILRFRFRGHPYDPAHFRLLPVPRTGTRRRGRYYRRMHTTQERREADGAAFDEDIVEYGVKVRAARNASNLVHAWDDVHRSSGRSWKRNRKTQWK